MVYSRMYGISEEYVHVLMEYLERCIPALRSFLEEPFST